MALVGTAALTAVPHPEVLQAAIATLLNNLKVIDMNILRLLTFIPGFGGGAPAPIAPPPPPAPVAPVARKTDVAVQKARADEIKRSKLAAGNAGTNKTKNLLATEEASTSKKTLLGY